MDLILIKCQTVVRYRCDYIYNPFQKKAANFPLIIAPLQYSLCCERKNSLGSWRSVHLIFLKHSTGTTVLSTLVFSDTNTQKNIHPTLIRFLWVNIACKTRHFNLAQESHFIQRFKYSGVDFFSLKYSFNTHKIYMGHVTAVCKIQVLLILAPQHWTFSIQITARNRAVQFTAQ